MSGNDVKEIFASNISKLRNQKNLTQKELADHLGLGKTTISEWESAKKLPNAGSIEKVAEFFGVPKSQLFETKKEQEEMVYEKVSETVLLPIVGKISCGDGLIAFEEIDEYEPTPKEWLGTGEHFYLTAKGDSMKNARIEDGDLLLIRRQEDVENGEIAAVLIDDEAVLKRVYKNNGTVILQSENHEYQPIILNGNNEQNIRIIGKLKKVVLNF